MARFARILVVILIATGCYAAADADTGGTPISHRLRVGLFSEPRATDPKSREAAWELLNKNRSFKVERITSETVRSGHLSNYDVIVFPGGTGNGEAKALGVDGGHAVTQFVKDGHGVIGICAGGYLIAEGWNPETSAIELVKADLWDSDHWARGEAFVAVKTVADHDTGTSRTMWFQNGPIFAPGVKAAGSAYVPLVKYVTDMAAKNAPRGMMAGRDAVIAGTLGKGRVVAFGPHPELSPDVHHWLHNAVKWAAAGNDGTSPTVESVLGRRN